MAQQQVELSALNMHRIEQERWAVEESARTIAATLQAKGYVVTVRPAHEVYLPGPPGPRPAVDLAFGPPGSDQGAVATVTTEGRASLERAAAQMPAATLAGKLVVPKMTDVLRR
jgi:hypothetical protein